MDLRAVGNEQTYSVGCCGEPALRQLVSLEERVTISADGQARLLFVAATSLCPVRLFR